MRLDDLRPTENVDDRRGRGGIGGPRLAVGGGGLGIVAVLVVSWLLGVDPTQFLSAADPNAGYEQSQTQTAGGPRADDDEFRFARQIVGSAEDVWSPLLRGEGASFSPATLTTYDRATPTGCGTGQSSAGPFYCPADNKIYLDLSFFDELRDRFGAPGEFARAYVIAHEYGHHIQNLLGVMNQHSLGSRGADSDSVRTELQADCYAGVWANHANQQFQILQSGDVEQGIAAASAVGDDTLERQGQGYVVPDSFTHGTSAQRVRWFQQGLKSGDPKACDTFAAGRL
ncbi:MAG TPA: neutral zinc metallopeptidase [Rhizomicrobium sp.]|jgi:hypothetical protein